MCVCVTGSRWPERPHQRTSIFCLISVVLIFSMLYLDFGMFCCFVCLFSTRCRVPLNWQQMYISVIFSLVYFSRSHSHGRTTHTHAHKRRAKNKKIIQKWYFPGEAASHRICTKTDIIRWSWPILSQARQSRKRTSQKSKEKKRTKIVVEVILFEIYFEKSHKIKINYGQFERDKFLMLHN